jgi:XTP/dITP diphosphohydrolase
VLTWSPRVEPGALRWAAWELLRGADHVIAGVRPHPLAPALADAGVEVRYVEARHLGDDVSKIAGPADLLHELAEGAGDGGTVVWLASATGDPKLLAALPDAEVLVGSGDVAGAAVLDLVAVMDRLRSPGGCAWDAEQTHTSLLTYLVEETYETVEAIETDDLVGLREELGDLLLQVVFHARIGQEHVVEPWSLDDVARGITDKLVRRHPHVFGADGLHGSAPAIDPATADELEGRWDRMKAAEKSRTSATDGVPLGQPALSLAAKLHDRAARAGVAPVAASGLVPAVPADDAALGELLLAIVVGARGAGLDPEAALRGAARRYAERIRETEKDGDSSAGRA